jgi:NADH-quinone oxidoreductase subunit J
MVYETIAFALFAFVTVASSVGVVLMRDVWHSALLLGVALFSVAIHFVMLQAEFLAAMQVLVYVGGVLILITFAVMLTRETPAEEPAGDPDRDRDRDRDPEGVEA